MAIDSSEEIETKDNENNTSLNCPVCGGSGLYYVAGMKLGPLYQCKRCGYNGTFVLKANQEMREHIEDEYESKLSGKRSQQSSYDSLSSVPEENTLVYAGFKKRALACLVDFVILGFVVGPLIYAAIVILNLLDVATEDFNIEFLFIFVHLFFYWVYFVGFESSSLQATPGKKKYNIKVTDLNGERISLMKATIRFFGKYVSFFLLFIGYIMIPFTEKKQGLHDMIAKTLVWETNQE